MSPAARALRVLWCGEPEFGAGFRAVREALRSAGRLGGGAGDVEVERCPRGDLPRRLGWADVAVPLMARVDADLLEKWARQGAGGTGSGYPRGVFQFGVGLEGVDAATASREGIWVANIPSSAVPRNPNAVSCAEMAMLLALACLRRWNAMQAAILDRKSGLPMGSSLLGKRCLVVGFGNIAQELIPLLEAFGAGISAVRRSAWVVEDVRQPSGGLAQRARAALDGRGVGRDDLLAMAADADVVFLTCVQNEETQGMVDREFLSSCKDGVTIVNVARGGLLDYDAVKSGLDSGKVGALGLDVQWEEPFDPADYVARHPSVVLTPHVAGVTELSYSAMGLYMAEKLIRLKDEGAVPSSQEMAR